MFGATKWHCAVWMSLRGGYKNRRYRVNRRTLVFVFTTEEQKMKISMEIPDFPFSDVSELELKDCEFDGIEFSDGTWFQIITQVDPENLASVEIRIEVYEDAEFVVAATFDSLLPVNQIVLRPKEIMLDLHQMVQYFQSTEPKPTLAWMVDVIYMTIINQTAGMIVYWEVPPDDVEFVTESSVSFELTIGSVSLYATIPLPEIDTVIIDRIPTFGELEAEEIEELGQTDGPLVGGEDLNS